MKLKVTIAILFFWCSTAYSQDYLIKNTLVLNDSIAFTSLQYGSYNFGYGVVNPKGVMTWQVPSQGFPLGMGKFHNNVVVFYSLENPDLHNIKDIHAAIVDLKTQKIINDKEIYRSEKRYQFVPFILDDPAGNFDFLLIRTTPQKIGLGSIANSWPNEKFNQTTQLMAFYLDVNLATQTKDIKSAALGSVLISACAGNNNDWYISSYGKGQLTVEKFNRDNNLQSKLTTAASINDNSAFFPLMKYDSIQGNCIDLAITYQNNHNDDVLQTFRYDFNEQKSYASDGTLLGKDYKRELEEENGEKKLSDFNRLKMLYPVQIVETNDKVIVLKEIEYGIPVTDDNIQQFWKNGSLITIYAKKDLHAERDIVIDKTIGTLIMGETGIASHVKDGKLYTVICSTTSQESYKTFLYITNMNDGTTEKKLLEMKVPGKARITYPATVCWFNDHFMIPFTRVKVFTGFKFETALQSESY